jgi:hypothetical protein
VVVVKNDEDELVERFAITASATEQRAAAIGGLASHFPLGDVRRTTTPGIGRHRVEQLHISREGLRILVLRCESIAGAEERQPAPARVRRRADGSGEPLESRRLVPALALQASELVGGFARRLTLSTAAHREPPGVTHMEPVWRRDRILNTNVVSFRR